MRRLGLALCAALFVTAPLGAGLSGASYFAALPLAGLVFLGALILRAVSPRAGAAELLPALMLCLASASLLLGAGHLLRGILGVQGSAPLLLWLVVGLVALAFASFLWPSHKMLDTDALLERALKRLNDLPPGRDPSMSTRPAMAETFEEIVSRADADALGAFLDAAQELLDERPDRASDLPTVGRLVDISGQIEQEHPELAEALVDLAHRLENLAEETDDR